MRRYTGHVLGRMFDAEDRAVVGLWLVRLTALAIGAMGVALIAGLAMRVFGLAAG